MSDSVTPLTILTPQEKRAEANTPDSRTPRYAARPTASCAPLLQSDEKETAAMQRVPESDTFAFTRSATAKAGPKRDMRIEITQDGPYVVSGGVPLAEEAITPVGGHMEYRVSRVLARGSVYALCRCGRTSNPPFCDGAHIKARFDGTERAPREPYEERADTLPGMGVFLLDDNRCAFARFCHREDGDVWSMTERSGNPRVKSEAIRASSDCPAGRLVHVDAQDGTVYEPELAPQISLLQDPQKGVSGPYVVRGGVTLISDDGSKYERRNRYALCRCGASNNKPFCDALHVSVGFQDVREQ